MEIRRSFQEEEKSSTFLRVSDEAPQMVLASEPEIPTRFEKDQAQETNKQSELKHEIQEEIYNPAIRELTGTKERFRRNLEGVISSIKSSPKEAVFVPIFIILAITIYKPLWLVWVGVIVGWSVLDTLYTLLPRAKKQRVKSFIPRKVRESRTTHELVEGMTQVRPFVLFGFYMGCAALAIAWIGVHWLVNLVRGRTQIERPAVITPDLISFQETSTKQKEEEEENFTHSPAFALVSLAIFGAGIPAAISYLTYQVTGMDPLFHFPSRDPDFVRVFLKIDLYIYSLAWCLSVLFFRAWMTFPLNFCGTDSEIEMTPRMVKRKAHNWFTAVISMNQPSGGRLSIGWDEVKYLGYECPDRVKLYPLPTKAFSAGSPVYKIANKVAQLFDAVTERIHSGESIYFSTAMPGELSSQFRMNLTSLDANQRAAMFYAVKQWAPHVVVDPRVQEAVVGSTVMQAPRYTQMWFELLTDKMPRRRKGALVPGEKLQSNAIRIESRLKSGGQANVYIATRGGEEVVLKEFILSEADAVGALVDSAGEFEIETTMLTELQHPGIVQMIDFFAEDRRLYLVLERVPGLSLREKVKTEGPLSEHQVIDIAAQITAVLSYLHAQTPPVVHRDISPDNIILRPDGRITLIDFSLAAAKKARRTTSTMGKHSYAPPEQLREQPCPQSDIYALGATMNYLLTGRDPRPITQSQVNTDEQKCSEEMDKLIRQATELELADRIEDSEWLLLALQKMRSAQNLLLCESAE